MNRLRITRPFHLLIAFAFLCSFLSGAYGQIFVSDFNRSLIKEYDLNGTLINGAFASSQGSSFAIADNDLYFFHTGPTATVAALSKYSIDGVTKNDAFILSGLTNPTGLAITQDRIYVPRLNALSVYSRAGTLLNASILSSITTPLGMVATNDALLIADYDHGMIGKYSLSGDTINSSFITGLTNPLNPRIFGDKIYVPDTVAGTIGVYDLNGVPINRSLIKNISGVTNVEIVDGYIYANRFSTVGKYNMDGSMVNASFISGLNGIVSMTAVQPVPECNNWFVLLALMVWAMGYRRWQARRLKGA